MSGANRHQAQPPSPLCRGGGQDVGQGDADQQVAGHRDHPRPAGVSGAIEGAVQHIDGGQRGHGQGHDPDTATPSSSSSF